MSNEVAQYEGQALEEVQEEQGKIPEQKPFQNTFNVEELLNSAGTVELSEEQRETLYTDVNEEDVEIREDGLIYLPWMEYARRLTKAFGMKWALIPQGMPTFENNYIYWGFWLIINGSLAGYAIGEQQYFPKSSGNKSFMTYGDACEGAKSNALMRLCKGIGISLELWKPSFIRKWKGQYAERYWDQYKGKYIWKRKGENTSTSEPSKEEKSKSKALNNSKPKPISDAQRKKLWTMMKEKGFSDQDGKDFYHWLNIETSKEASEAIKNFEDLFGQYIDQQEKSESDDQQEGEFPGE